MTPWMTNTLPPAVLARAKALVQTQVDPLSAFIYDLGALRDHTRWLKSFLPEGVELYYAMKANSEQRILETLAPLVDGFEISSGGEIQRAHNCSINKKFIFSGPGKLDSDLHSALIQRVEMIHLESLEEIRRLNNIAANLNLKQRVLIRINPVLPTNLSSRLSMAGVPTPFGIDEPQLSEAVTQVQQSDHLVLCGFHIHAMSHQTNVLRHRQLLDWYLAQWPRWKALAAPAETVRYLNVGGGIGVDYLQARQFDWPGLCGHLEKKLRRFRHPPVIRFEPGRFVTAFCGYYLMQILDIKHNHNQGFAVCRGGTHQFRLPAAQAHDHPVVHIPLEREKGDPGRKMQLTITGQLCTPKDVLARNVVLRDPRAGDLLALPLAGAYGYNISHADFLCHPRPEQVFIDSESTQAQMHLSDGYVPNASY